MTAKPDADWSEPGVFEVAAGVHRIPLPLPNDGLRAVNVYAVEEEGGVVLVDSGWAIPEARVLLEGSLRALDCSFADVRRFLITHIHRDHYTQAVALRRDFATPIELGIGERASLDAILRAAQPLEAQGRQLLALGAAELLAQLAATRSELEPGDRDVWEDPDTWLEEGTLVLASGRSLEIVETPGHTQGHVVYHDLPNSLLFAGDHVLPTITPSIGLEPVISPNPLGAYLASLAKIRRRPDATLLPAHGGVTDSVHARIDELIDHHGLRLEQTESAVAAGATTGAEVAEQLRWTRRLRRMDELTLFNQMLAVGETGAHLEVLVAQGRLTRTTEAGVYRYQV